MKNICFRLPFLAILALTILSSCQEDVLEPAGLKSITIKTPPAKVDYYVGDILDLTGLVVTLHMDNGESEDINFADFSDKGIYCYPENGEELTIESGIVEIMEAVSKKSTEQIIKVNYYTCIENYLNSNTYTVQRTTESDISYDENYATHRGYIFKPLKDIAITAIGGMIAKSGNYKIEIFKFDDTSWDPMAISENLLVDTITIDNTESFLYKSLETNINLRANQRYLVRYFNNDHSSVYDIGLGNAADEYISFPLQTQDIEIEIPYYSYAYFIDNEVYLSSYGTFNQGIMRGLPDFKYKPN